MLDSLGYSTIPTIFKLLSMMNHEDLTRDLKYVDMCSEFQDLDIYDAVDVYTLGVEHLATFGFLGMDGARLLYKYTHDIILSPLGLMKTRLSEEPSVEEVAAPTQAVVKHMKQDDKADDDEIEDGDDIEESDDMEDGDGQPINDEGRKAVLEWLLGVQSCEEEGSDVSQEI